MPASAAENDVAVMHVISYKADPNDLQIRDVSGWTQLAAEVEGVTQSVISQRMFYKVLGASETDVTVQAELESSSTQAGRLGCAIIVFDGVDTTTPVDVASQSN